MLLASEITNNRARAATQFTPLPPTILTGSCVDQVIRETQPQRRARSCRLSTFTAQVSGFHRPGLAHSCRSPPTSQSACSRKLLLLLLCPYLLAGLLCKVMITALYHNIFTSWGHSPASSEQQFPLALPPEAPITGITN